MEKVFICNEDWPVVETKQGKLRGYFFDDVFVFQGIKYADAKRFQMPEPVAPWEGIRDALGFGYNCPGPAQPRFMPRGEVAGPHRFWPESEHCQYLNIWTGSINPGAKKPVLVWLHGGGYVDGSAIEMIAYDGDHLAKYDDVVVVSVNHRLNVLGHLDMSDFGPEYENSGNAGFADLVAALQWVHENIEGFGGDPNNVTVFGQSGGGGKVSALLQIPSAEGLFQKAIVMSGIITDDNVLVHTTAVPKMIVAEIMKEMGLEEDELERFISAPEIILERATDRAVKNLNKKGYVVGWGPKPNGWYAGSLCLNTSTAFSKKIPTMVGTAFAEFNRTPSTVDKSKMTEEDILHQTEEKFGEKAGEFLRIFRKAYPYVDEAYAVCTDTFTQSFADLVKQFSESAHHHFERILRICMLISRPQHTKQSLLWHLLSIIEDQVLHKRDPLARLTNQRVIFLSTREDDKFSHHSNFYITGHTESPLSDAV